MKIQNQTLYFVSLGCSKNLVDSEVMLGLLKNEGVSIITEPSEATTIIVNTCGFVEAAKQESVDMILDMASYKDPAKGRCQALVVSGCLAQRYPEELAKELPEVDFFVGTGEYPRIVEHLNELFEGQLKKRSFVEVPKFIHTELDPRLNSSPAYMAWLKVSEGCDRHCTFCIIPKLRGNLRSRSVESLIIEAKGLVAQGVKELNLISQDLSQYAKEFGGMDDLLRLLRGLEEIEGLEWIRLFYFYPDELDERFMKAISNSKKICHYLDMPIQHFSNPVLKRMNRNITGEEVLAKIAKLRAMIPDISLRTSVIVGFPGETDEDFEKLLNGLKVARFNHLGAFKYSDEEGTAAYRLQDKIQKRTIEARHKKIYALQEKIAGEMNKAYIGKVLSVLIEGHHEETELLVQGRHAGQAPEIDGKVIINDLHEKSVKIGDIVSVLITDVSGHDLIGELALS